MMNKSDAVITPWGLNYTACFVEVAEIDRSDIGRRITIKVELDLKGMPCTRQKAFATSLKQVRDIMKNIVIRAGKEIIPIIIIIIHFSKNVEPWFGHPC